MGRKTFFVDLPVKRETREKIKKKKGSSSYDDFFNSIIDFDLSTDNTDKKIKGYDC